MDAKLSALSGQELPRRLQSKDFSKRLVVSPILEPEEQLKRETGYLFPNDFIIFDEAHTVERVASILDLIPHRPPFCLIDRVIMVGDGRVVAEKLER